MEHNNIMHHHVINNNNSEPLIEQVAQYKLTLRKNKLHTFLSSKRKLHLSNQQEPIAINIAALPQYHALMHMKFSSGEGAYQFIINTFTSNDINDIKYGIVLLKEQMNPENNDITFIQGLYKCGIVNDILQLLEKYINDISIVYEIIWCLINFTYYINDTALHNTLTNAKYVELFYYVFKYQNISIVSVITWLFNNICIDGGMNSECMRHMLFQKDMIHYANDFIAKHANTCSSVFLSKIENEYIAMSVSLFCNIVLYNKINTSFHIDNDVITNIITSLVNFTQFEINDTIIPKVIYTLYELNDNIFDNMAHFLFQSPLFTSIINNTHSNTSSFTEPTNQYISALLGNIYYSLNGNDINNGTFDNIIRYELQQLRTVKDGNLKMEVYWHVSNLIGDCVRLIKRVLMNEEFMKEMVSNLEKEVHDETLREGLNCILLLITYASIDEFRIMISLGIFDIVMDVGERCENEEVVIKMFSIVYIAMKNCEVIKGNTNNVNWAWDRFCKKGGEELLKKYGMTQSMKLGKVIQDILMEFGINNTTNIIE